MTAREIECLFQEIGQPAPGSMAARPVQAGSPCRVARSCEGFAALLILFEQCADGSVPPPGEQLANLEYRPRERVLIEGDDGLRREVLCSILSCRAADSDLRGYFFRIVSVVLDALGNEPEVREVDEAMSQMLELFRALEHPGARSLQGIWAELLLIANSIDPEELVTAWHAEPEAVHDFVSGPQRLEVKCTSQPLRRHHFSLDQLCPSDGCVVAVFSMFVVAADEGVSAVDLVDRIRERLPTASEIRRRLEVVLAASLGVDWRLAALAKFDEASALETLRVYFSDTIPRVNLDLPPEVSNVHFLVDLSSVEAASVRRVEGCGGLIAAALPR